MDLSYPVGVATRTPLVAIDADARQMLELRRKSWTLALGADGKSARTLDTYGESADQFIGFLASPPLHNTSYMASSSGEPSSPPQVKGPSGFIWALLMRHLLEPRVATELLGAVVHVDVALSDLLAVYLGRGDAEIELLADEVISFMSFDSRMRLLARIMEENSWASDFPDLLSAMKRVLKLRNLMAHSYTVESGEPQADGVIVRRSYRRGKEADHRVGSDELAEALQLAQGVISEALAELLRRSLQLRGTYVAISDDEPAHARPRVWPEHGVSPVVGEAERRPALGTGRI